MAGEDRDRTYEGQPEGRTGAGRHREIDAGWPGAKVEPSDPAVRVQTFDGRLELTFDRGFTAEDVAVVKAIPGRRWVPAKLAWNLPGGPGVMGTLSRAFGARLVVRAAARRGRSGPAMEPAGDQTGPRSPSYHEAALVGAVRREVRVREYSPRTETAYVGWVRRFIGFHGDAFDRSDNLDASHARAFLQHLAAEEGLAAGSRNQAAAALSFMFREVLGRDELGNVPRAKGPKRVPMVLTHREVLHVLRQLTGKYFLVAVLLYSAGLRLEECLQLRVKDVDFELRQILVRDGKGRKDRYVPLARRAVDLLRAQIRRVAELHAGDRAEGHGWAPLPGALHRKDPAAGYELGWQYIFPATVLNTDPATDRTGRWPLHATAVQRQVKAAVRRSGLPKRATCHTLRHSFATEALRGGCDIRTLQNVMGHKDLRTTTIYLHVVEQTGMYIRSPLDRPDDPDDFDLDPVGRRWAGTEAHWDLAARQWDPEGHDGLQPKKQRSRRPENAPGRALER